MFENIFLIGAGLLGYFAIITVVTLYYKYICNFAFDGCQLHKLELKETLNVIFTFIFFTGLFVSVYFWGTIIEFSVMTNKYDKLYNMTDGCLLINCTTKLSCHQPYSTFCWKGGLWSLSGIFSSLFVIFIYITVTTMNRRKNNEIIEIN
jgi:hypothetical protein